MVSFLYKLRCGNFCILNCKELQYMYSSSKIRTNFLLFFFQCFLSFQTYITRFLLFFFFISSRSKKLNESAIYFSIILIFSMNLMYFFNNNPYFLKSYVWIYVTHLFKGTLCKNFTFCVEVNGTTRSWKIVLYMGIGSFFPDMFDIASVDHSIVTTLRHFYCCFLNMYRFQSSVFKELQRWSTPATNKTESIIEMYIVGAISHIFIQFCYNLF